VKAKRKKVEILRGRGMKEGDARTQREPGEKVSWSARREEKEESPPESMGGREGRKAGQE
jgi:hypothetical protein